MSERILTDAEAAALSGQTIDAGVTVPITAEKPWHPPANRALYRLAQAIRAAAAFEVFPSGTAGLTFGVRPGTFSNGSNTVVYAGTDGASLTDDSTNSIWLEFGSSAATLAVGTNGFPDPSSTPHMPLAQITCADGTYTFDDVTDCRERAIFRELSGLTAEAANILTGGVNSYADSLHNHHLTAESLWTAEGDTSKVLKPDGTGGVQWGTQTAGASVAEDLTTSEMDTGKVLKPDGAGGVEWGNAGAGTNGAPTDASYWVGGSNASLPNAIVPTGENGITVDAGCGTISQTFGTNANQAAAGNHTHPYGTGNGDFSGPSSSVDSNFLSFNGVGGKTGKDSGYSPSSFSAAGHTHSTATTSGPGFMPQLDGDANHYFNGQGGLSTPPGGSSETIVRKLTQLALTATTQVAYICPTSYCAQVSLNLANLDATSQCAATVYVNDVSGSATATIANGLLVNKNNSHVFGQKINLEAGDKILLAAGGASQFDAILAIREKLLSSAIETWKMQATATLGTGAAAAYTCPAGKYAKFVMMAGNVLSTTAATSVTFKINDVSGTTTLTIGNALAINKNQYLPYSFDSIGDDGFLIEAGDSLQANANGTGAVSLVVNASEWSV